MLTKQAKLAFYRLLGGLIALVPVSVFANVTATGSGGFAADLASRLAVRDNSVLVESLDEIYKLLIGVCYIMGVSFTLMAIYRLRKYGTGSALMHSPRSLIGPGGFFMIGTILMFTPHFLDIMVKTLWGYDSVMAYRHISDDAAFREMIRPLIGIIQVVGLIAFIRGWILVSKSTKEGAQPGSLSKGVIHVVGGILAINIVGTVEIITTTLGNG